MWAPTGLWAPYPLYFRGYGAHSPVGQYSGGSVGGLIAGKGGVGGGPHKVDGVGERVFGEKVEKGVGEDAPLHEIADSSFGEADNCSS